MRCALGLLLVMGAATPAFASETPRYEPAPAWVTPAPAPKAGGAGGSMFALMDQQTRIADGAVWSYREIATRAITAGTLAHMGTVSLNWQPFHGDLVIHRLQILRDGQRIDALAGGKTFTVIRREQGLEKLEMNGLLTATLQVEGLRVGDVLDFAYSVSAKDPALKGGVQASDLAVAAPFKVDDARVRLLWPTGSPIRWRSYLKGLDGRESDANGWHEVRFVLPAPKQPDLPADSPKRFRPIGAIESSSFADWQAVSAVFAPLYRTDGLIAPGSALAQEVAAIRARSSDPHVRAAAALDLVQDRIRYFADGMNGGNYTPQSPERTWAAGYGDCKAKTLLLLAMLHALGIEAEPILANIGGGDLVAIRLPAPQAFNHILVHARIGDEDLWLDGTGRGARQEDMADPPPFRSVLPVREGGAALLTLPQKAPARPTRTTTVEIDDSAALGLGAPFSATVVVRGAMVDTLRALVSQLDPEKLLLLAQLSLGGAAGPDAEAATQRFDFDPKAGTATISATGIARLPWRRQDHAYRLRPASTLPVLKLNADRTRPAWKDIPVSLGDADHTVVTTRLRLPDGGRDMTLEGDGAFQLDIAGHDSRRRAALAGDLLTVEETSRSDGSDLPAADLPAVRSRLAAVQGRSLRLVTGPDYPAPYQQVEAALHAHRLDRLAALHSQIIAVKPDDPVRYINRAAFYERTFQRALALADLDHAASLDANATTLLRRAALLEEMGANDRAAADYQTVLGLDPSARGAITRLGLLQVDAGHKDEALAAIDEHLDAADEDKPEWRAARAEILARAGDATGALDALDKAVAAKPDDASLLNQRCWIKGTLAVQLDTALADCTRAVELTEDNTEALDSRAMVYFRLNRLAEAMADVDAALDRDPDLASSLYLRAVLERRTGHAQAADRDEAGARLLSPRIDADYARWKIKA